MISLKIHLEKNHFFQQMKQVVTLTKIQHCLWILTILQGSNRCGFIQKVIQLRLKHNLVEKGLFQDTSRKRITSNLSEDEKKELKDWRKNVFFNRDSDKVVCLQERGIGLLLLITDNGKANEQIERSSILKIDLRLYNIAY